MNIPVHIQFIGLDASDFVSRLVHEQAEKLEGLYDRITSCHVALSQPHRHHRKGNIFHVQIRISVPQEEIVVSVETKENPLPVDTYNVIRDGFDCTRRRLIEYVGKRRCLLRKRAARVKSQDGIESNNGR